MKLWQKKDRLDERIARFNVGNDHELDKRLVEYDCRASIAHARMLAKIGILTQEEFERIETALKQIQELNAEGNFEIRPEDEDCHTAIELYLTSELGETGEKIHTARSRNDQVLTALRLYYMDAISEIDALVANLLVKLKRFKEKHGRTKFAGFTHTRKAMPTTMAIWSEAYAEAIIDDGILARAVERLISQSPLGTAAGYGVPIKIDRKMTSRELGFRTLQTNPIYVQNSRGKFELSLLHFLGQVMYDLNRMACDVIFFTLPEIGYLTLPDNLCTGSSIMPQKKNPDALELIRGNAHTVFAQESHLRSLTANLISGYHRDLQLSKEPVFRALDATMRSLEAMTIIADGLGVDREACKRSLTEDVMATRDVYRLVLDGVPFRQAYHRVSERF